nr:retrovirus-related Pol polyprotein from transposon TNT 1-94 [Tanacetum cinerariifolium]
MVPTTLLTKSKLVPITTARPVTAATSKPLVTGPRQAKTVVNKTYSPPRRHINCSPSPKVSNFPPKVTAAKAPMGNPHHALKDKGVIDSGCPRHMTGNMSYLFDFETINGGYVTFGGNPKGGEISRKGKIRTGKLDFDDVYFVKELKFNLSSASQMCNKNNNVLSTDTKCNLVRGLPSKVFENDYTCVAYKKGKQHRASCKTKPVSSVNQPLQRLHMDLIGPTFVKSLNKKSYCLVVIDDYSRFTWMFFLATKDETSPILKTFLIGIENQLSLKVKIVKSDKGTELKNNALNQFYEMKGIKREFSVPKTPQQNGIVERKNKTLIEAARTMLADSLLPIPFWTEAVNTACYNTDGDAAFKVKEPVFKGRKPEFAVHVSPSSSAQSKKHDDKTKREAKGKSPVESSTRYRNLSAEFEDFSDNSINEVNAAESLVPIVGKISTNSTNTFSALGPSNTVVKADFNNLETSVTVNPIPTTRVHKDHPVTQIIDDLSSATQIRIMTRVAKDQGGLSQINNDDFHTCTKWVFRNKKDERGIVVRNKARLVAQGHTQEERIDYKEVFAPVARIEAIRLFLAYASFMGFMVHQMDVKSAFLYGTIEEERGKIDQTLFIKMKQGDILLVQMYVDDIVFGSTNKDLCKAFEKLIKYKFQMSSMGEVTFLFGLQAKQKQDWIFISHDKYVADILRKFGLKNRKSTSTPIDTEKPLLKDPDGEDVDVHTYRLIIGTLMYLTSSRPDILFAVCACAHFQVTRKASHLHAVKRIFRYLKGKPHLGLWYLKDSPFNLVAYSHSDYAGCKKQTVVATSSTEAEYVAATSRKFNFSKYIFDSIVRNMDSFTKLYMYPRFLQLMIRTQVGDLSSYSTKYLSPALTQKVFANMRRVGKGFSGVDTRLFEGMIVAQQVDEGAAKVNVDDVPTAGVAAEGAASVNVDDVPAVVDEQSIPSPTPHTQPPQPSQDIPSTSQVHPTPPPSLTTQPPPPQQQLQPSHDAEMSMDLLNTLLDTCTTLTRRGRIIADMDANEDVTLKDVADIAKEVVVDVEIEESADDDDIEPAELQEVVEVVTTAKLRTEVVTAASATITAADTLIPVATITAAAPTITTPPSAARRRKGVVIRYLKETSTPSTIIHTEPISKEKGKGIMVHEPKPLKKKTQIEQDEAYARELEAELNKNIDWDEVIEQVKTKEKEDNVMMRNMAGFKMDYFKGMTYDDIRLIFEKKFNSNVALLEKTKEKMEEEDSKALKRISESQEDKAAKRQKLDEKVEELRKHPQIVPNDDDDVYT